ncbi:MAG: hypothetical protein PHC68_09275 [Syntrophorhabdaceae bacterium]|nr:hypothetical protein [Syntrophorhabdaceae bacterium]
MKLSEKNGEQKYDCQKCGACCVYYCYDKDRLCMQLRDEDLKYIPKDKITYVSDDYMVLTDGNPGIAMMKAVKRGKHYRCVFLKGTIGKSVACLLQKHKPVGCKNFLCGDYACETCRKKILGRGTA